MVRNYMASWLWKNPQFKAFFRSLLRRQGLLLRLIVCWTVGSFVIFADERTNFDTRFKIRGAQPASSNVVVLWLRPSDINRYYDIRTQTLIHLNELSEFSDGFFWDQKLWYQILGKILTQSPQSIGVAVYFGDNVGRLQLTRREAEVFFDPRVFWASQVDSFDQLVLPILAKSDLSNIGQYEIYRDEDGLVRKIMSAGLEGPHLTEKMVGKRFPPQTPSQLINFRGPSRVFQSTTVDEILNNEVAADFFKNKIVLVGVESASSLRFLTPVGQLTRTEIMAHVLDNLKENRWIKKVNFWFYSLYALVLVILAVLIITRYPQSVAFAFLFWLGLLCLTLSVWFFDSLNIWLPGLSAILLLLIVWVVFVGYQASVIERRNFMLQEEQKYLQELEQLKSNFVSLISHDLKTPLAKIEAVIDRLKQNSNQNDSDLDKLQDYTGELNRYIQSILKVMRIETQDFQLNLDSTDLNEIIDEVVRSLKPLAENKKQNLSLQLEPLFLVDLDPVLIREVIQNIVENAIKYSGENTSIQIRSFEKETEVGFEVIDEGEGIPDTELDQVWGKFVRGQAQNLRSKGTGLGLYLVKYFVELHGGRVTLQSQVGKGTTVGFFLPLSSETFDSTDDMGEV